VWKWFLLAGALVVGGCSPPHRFIVEGAEEAENATLTLNNESSPMEKRSIVFVAERGVSDASGAIRIRYADGQHIDCRIGYITNGEAEPHLFRVVDGKCVEVGR
jgi:hypothetical protein